MLRKRATEACTFCRRRKIKCNGEHPTCANCKVYGKACSYEPIGGPTRQHQRRGRQRRAQSEDAAQAIEGPLNRDTSSSADVGGANLRDIPQNHSQTEAVEDSPSSNATTHSRTVSRIVFSANGISSFHGPTSTLFEENLADRQLPNPTPRLPPEWVEKGLLAEAARQRQMEDINFAAGKLDFDGVDQDLGRHLLSLHWNRQHHSFLITYRPSFMRDMACNGPYFSKILLNAIYFGSSKFSSRIELRKDPNDVRTAGWKFKERVQELLGSALGESSITTIQALLMMTNSLFALGDERSAAWLYSGLAFRMIIDLGMHVDSPALPSTKRFSDEDLEIRRRVFWGAFVVDKIQSLYQGRPASLQEADMRVPITFLDTYEELENWSPFAYSTSSSNVYLGSPAYSVSTFTALCKLSIIMSHILSCIYAERSFDRSAEELSNILQDLNSKLDAWSKELPPHLNFDPSNTAATTPPPHVLSLLAMYDVLVILLHRPFVADGHLHNNSRSLAVNSFLACATAATQIVSLLRAYDEAFSTRRAPYLISYATYVSATVHVRIAAKQDPSSDAHSCLRTCLQVFQQNQETNWAVRRANMIVQSLMMKFGVSLSGTDETSPVSRGPNSRNGNERQSTLYDVNSRRVGIQQEAHHATRIPDQSAPGLDIDAIIETFVQRQRAQGHISDQSLTYDNASSISGPDYGQQPRAGHYDTAGLGMNSVWQESHEPAFQSVEDLLFGFNGSELDYFPI